MFIPQLRGGCTGSILFFFFFFYQLPSFFSELHGVITDFPSEFILSNVFLLCTASFHFFLKTSLNSFGRASQAVMKVFSFCFGPIAGKFGPVAFKHWYNSFKWDLLLWFPVSFLSLQISCFPYHLEHSFTKLSFLFSFHSWLFP